MGTDQVERRAHPRVSTAIVVKLANDQGCFDEFMTRDISMGGVFIHTDFPRMLGERFEIILCLPDGSEEITVLGEVMLISGFGDREERPNPKKKGMGIRFVLVEPMLQKELERFICSLLSLPDGPERRHPRIKARLRVKVKTGEQSAQALLSDISKGGMSIHIASDSAIRDHLEVTLVHPESGDEIALLGKVIHKKEYLEEKTDAVLTKVGIKFVDLNNPKREEIDGFIQRVLLGAATQPQE